MIEPRRLCEDETNPLGQRLLETGRAYRASSVTRARTAAALGIGAAPLIATGKAAAAAGLVAKVAMVGALATTASVIAYRAVQSPAERLDLPAETTVHGTAPAVSPKPAEVAPAPTAVQVEDLAFEAAPSPAARPGSHSDALSQELARLDSARKKLGAGQASQAIAELDAYRREFPRGSLRMEASVLRIEALAKAGRTSEARDSARRFLSQHPKSVLGARVKRYAGE